MENVATYSEARSEYTKQLATFIVPSIVAWFQTLWARNASDRQRCLSAFQNECEEIARWNQDRIHDEVRVLLERSGCDYMEELMTAVFVAHTKVLTAVRLSSKQKKLSITVPKLDHFLHRVFRECARCFWKTPFLFMSDGGVVERQKNILQVEALASEAITTAIRGMLPVKQILQDYLGDDADEEEEAAEVGPVTPEVKAEAEAEEEAEVKEEAVEKKEVVEAKEEVKAEAEAEVKEIKEEKKEAEVEADGEKAEAEAPPSIIKIDTEPSVHFSNYDTVFDETNGAPEMSYKPKEDGDDDDEEVDIPADGLIIHEGPATPLTADDAEDLDAPVPTLRLRPIIKKDTIDDSDVVILE